MNLNTPFFKKARFYLLFFCIVIALLSLLDIWSEEPKNLQEAESFLRQSNDVVAQVGMIQTVKLRKWRTVSSAGEIPGYREFYFYIKGQEREAIATVRSDLELNENKVNRYTIQSLDVLQ